MKHAFFLTLLFGAACAQAAISGISVKPTGAPAIKGRKDVPIATVTFAAAQDAQAEKLRLDIRGTNPSDVVCFSLGQSECARVENDAATFTVPVKKGQNTFSLYAELSDTASVGRPLRIDGERIRVASVVTRPAQEIVDRRLPNGKLRASKNFRIPGIVMTPKGTLVAVFDIRYKHAGDLPADITVGVSTSKDGGDTWSPIRTAIDYAGLPGGNGIGDPAILVDPSNNRVWVIALRAPKSGHPIFKSKTGTVDPAQCGQLFVAYSDDEGETWSEPRNITAEAKRLNDPDTANWGCIFQGPGAGIALKDGTLVFPAQIWGNDGKAPHHGALIYSKDHGETWTSSKASPFGGSESTVVQLPDGSLLLNTREGGGPRTRVTARTTDLGQTWQKLETSPLRQPGNLCQAAMLRVGDTLVFSNPNSGKRDTMTLRKSTDNGKTWSKGIVYDPRACAGYSTLCPMRQRGQDYVGVLYEGQSDYHYFQRIPLGEIQ